MVCRVINGLEAVHQVPDLLGLEHQGRALQTVGNVAGFQGPFQGRQTSAGWHQDADVGVGGGAVRLPARFLGDLPVQDLPTLGDDLLQKRGDVRGFFLPDVVYRGVHGPVGQRPDPGAQGAFRGGLPAGSHRPVVRLDVSRAVPWVPFPHPARKQVVDPVGDWPLGAEILDEADGLSSRLLHPFLQPPHLFYVGAAEAVDGLLGVPHDKEFSPFRADPLPRRGTRLVLLALGNVFRQEHGDLGLDGVGVLGLVDEEVGETAAEVVPHLNLVPQHVPGPDQQVVKLGPALRPAPFGVPQSETPQPAENLSERVPSDVFQFL